MRALVFVASLIALSCTPQQRGQVKAAASDVSTAVDAACALVAAVGELTDEVKAAQRLCEERTAPPWRILEAVADCGIEAR